MFERTEKKEVKRAREAFEVSFFLLANLGVLGKLYNSKSPNIIDCAAQRRQMAQEAQRQSIEGLLRPSLVTASQR